MKTSPPKMLQTFQARIWFENHSYFLANCPKMDGGGVKMVVEVCGELPWRKNLHGSLDLSLFGEESEEDGREREWGGREREEKLGILKKLKKGG